MVSQSIKIRNKGGLHLRPAGELCNVAIRFESKITFQANHTQGNAKSVLSVLGACLKQGDEMVLTCEGTDEQEAMQAIMEAVENGLGEVIDEE